MKTRFACYTCGKRKAARGKNANGTPMRRCAPCTKREHARRANMPHTVYKLSFPEYNAHYIGVTKRYLTERLHGHKHSPVNFLVGKYLREGAEYRMHEIATYKKRGNALKREAAEIERERVLASCVGGTTILNVADTGLASELVSLSTAKRTPEHKRIGMFAKKSGRKYARKSSAQKCSWCYRILPASNFHSDPTRSSGLMSRCRECQNVKGRATYWAKKSGRKNAVSAAHAKAKAERRAFGLALIRNAAADLPTAHIGENV